MLRKMVLGSVAAFALLVIPAAANAQFSQGDWVLTLGGNGSSDKKFRGTEWDIDASLAYFVSDQIGVGVRQNIAFNNSDNSSSASKSDDWNATTSVFGDFHIDLGRFQPYVGAEIGYLYGDKDIEDSWFAGPEAGVKFFVNSTTFIYGNVKYQFIFDDTDQIDSSFDEGRWVYTLGLGVRLGSGV